MTIPVQEATGLTGARLVVATTNRGKLLEIRTLLADLGLAIDARNEYGSMPPVEEDGATYAANAIKKATQIATQFGVAALGDDSGLEVEALGGEPGLRSARFAGPCATDAENRRLLLERLRDVPRARRGARFRCVMALVSPSGRVRVVEGAIDGVIREREAGCGGFGYDPVFELPDRGVTFAELGVDEKNRISHRARAIERIRDILVSDPAWRR